jgi:cold shock CspA family protein
MIGTLITWFAARRYGFIAPEKSGQEIFVHLSDIEGGIAPPRASVVEYEVAEFKGKTKATHVTPLLSVLAVQS